MATDSVSKVLGDAPELKVLQERLNLIDRLQRSYRTIAPGELARVSRVSAIDGTTVVIYATSGPVAAALRQVAPRLLSGLQKSNALKENEKAELTGIRVEVQVEVRPARRAVVPREPMPVERLAKVAEAMSDSPLKETLGRMARPQSKRTREKT
ncbi:DciA family protein [Usitatibacter rugosus]|nr:DciA family protein [Usitatibacter rugosus]